MKIVFQGDSVTDAGENLGGIVPGYVVYVREWLKKYFPMVENVNKAISGNRTIDLVERWQKDTIDLKPDIVSIMIGVNDVWREIDSNLVITNKELEENYKNILEQTQKIGAKILMIQPFILRHGTVNEQFVRVYQEKKKVIDKLAEKYADEYIKLGDIFDCACLEVDSRLFSTDGVHPSAYGSKFIAEIVEKYLYRLIK